MWRVWESYAGPPPRRTRRVDDREVPIETVADSAGPGDSLGEAEDDAQWHAIHDAADVACRPEPGNPRGPAK